MLRLTTIIDRISDAVGKAASWLALVMVLVGAWNAIARWIDRETGSDLSSNMWLETQWYLFAALFLFAGAWTLRRGAHVRVDVVYSHLSPKGRAWVDLLGVVFLLIPFCLFVIWGVLPAVEASWAIKEGSPDPGGLPRWPLRAAVPVAFTLLLLAAISMGLKAVMVLTGRGEVESEKLEVKA